MRFNRCMAVLRSMLRNWHTRYSNFRMEFVKTMILLLLVLACQPERTKPEQKTSGIALGRVDERLAEASGLVASIINPGFLWTLNDSRNPAEIFLIDQQAN